MSVLPSRCAAVLGALACGLLLGAATPDAGGPSDRAPSDVQERATELVRSGDRGAAAELLEEARAGYPRDPHVHWMLGRLYEETGRRSQAEAAFRKATELHDKHLLAWSDLAALLERRGAHEEALAAAHRAVALSPDSPGVRADRAVIRYRLGQLDAALADIERATRRVHDDPDLLLDHALMALTRGKRHDTDKAVALLTIAKRLVPGDDLVSLAYAQALLADGETKQAAAAYDAILARHPRQAWAAYGRGLAAWRQGDHERARQLGRLARSVLPRTFTASAWSRRRFHAHDARAWLQWLDARLDTEQPVGPPRPGEVPEAPDGPETPAEPPLPARPAGAARIERLEVQGDCDRGAVLERLRAVREEITTCYGEGVGQVGFRLEGRGGDTRVATRLGRALGEAPDRCLAQVAEGLDLPARGECTVDVVWNRPVRRLPTVAPLHLPVRLRTTRPPAVEQPEPPPPREGTAP